MDTNTHIIKLIKNMNVGYKYWEFYNNIIPFIIRHAYTLHYMVKEEIYLSNLFEKSLNIDSFIISKINNIDSMTTYIERKVTRIKKALYWLNSFEYPINITTLHQIITSTDFIDNYDYINKKIHVIIGSKTIEKLKEWVGNDIITIEIMNRIIRCIITYNEKINMSNVPCNYMGFEIIYNNYISGIKKNEFEKYIVPFISNHFSDKSILKIILEKISLENFNTMCTSYFDTIHYIKEIMIINKINITDFYLDGLN